MAPTYMTTTFGTCSDSSLNDLYMVNVEDFDGESYDFEVSATSYDDASKAGQRLAASMGITIYNMSIAQLVLGL